MGGGPEQGSEASLASALAEFNNLKPVAEARDAQELDNALSTIQTGCFRGAYDSSATQRLISELKDRLDEVDAKLNQNLPKIIAMYDSSQEIRGLVVPGWDNAITQLNSVRQRMSLLSISDWQGSSGEAYRQRISVQAREADKQIAIATNARRSIDAVAQLQCSIIQAAEKEHSRNLQWVNMARAAIEVPAATFSRGAAILPGTNKTHFDFFFYNRTAALVKAFVGLAHEACRLVTGDPWRHSSTDIAELLGVAVSEIQTANSVSIQDYNPVKVDNEGRCHKTEESARIVRRGG